MRHSQRLSCLLLASVLALKFTRAAESDNDPYLWLEDAHGAKAMSWVQAENDKTLAVLEKDPRYPELNAEALAIAEAEDRIPRPSTIDGSIYNFWQGKG